MALRAQDTAHFNREVLGDLLEIGISLSSYHDVDQLLEKILLEARRLTRADAGTIYVTRGEKLSGEMGQCETFIRRWGVEKAKEVFKAFSLPIDNNSIAGAAASLKEVVNVPDVQAVDENCLFKYNPDYDQANKYSTHSNLAVPMLDQDDNVIGVLQLINAMNGREIVPFNSEQVRITRALASQAAVALSNAILTEELFDAHLDTLKRLGIAAEWRDKETANHITRVAHYSELIAKALGWDSKMINIIKLASSMHDVGKLGVPDAILHKPGRLDDKERSVMETHAIIGANIMAKADNDVMRWSRIVALGHHEKWDGSGYPVGQKGEEIPSMARIVALADVYDALSSRRVYKPAFAHEKTMAIIDEESGRHFDPEIVIAFKSVISDIRKAGKLYEDKEEDFEKFRNYEALTLEE